MATGLRSVAQEVPTVPIMPIMPIAPRRVLLAAILTLAGLVAPASTAVAADASPFVYPSSGRITDGYWSKRRYGSHGALDMTGDVWGNQITAARGGKIVHAGWKGDYGNLIIIEHEAGYRTRYGHLSRIDVKWGQTVKTGEVIGIEGSTGNSTGSHLHLEVRRNGQTVVLPGRRGDRFNRGDPLPGDFPGILPDRAAELIRVAAPRALRSGETGTVEIRIRNTGPAAWKAGVVRIGTASPRDRNSAFDPGTWGGPARPVFLGADVQPGAEGRFSFRIRAPEVDAQTEYREAFGLVEEAVAWFEGFEAAFTVSVLPRPKPVLALQLQADGTNGRLRVTNTGDADARQIVVRVAMTGPGARTWVTRLGRVRAGRTTDFRLGLGSRKAANALTVRVLTVDGRTTQGLEARIALPKPPTISERLRAWWSRWRR